MENRLANLFPATIYDQKILIAALDWGFGHTTRCAALIRQLLKNNNQVIFAGNTQQTAFIKNEFANIITHNLNGYNITLDSQKNTYIQLIKQGRNILKAIKTENKWLQRFIESNQVDIVISDNRYGLYHPKITNIILTHQLTPQVPFFKNSATKLIHKKIQKFDLCWIPDFETQQFTGALSNHQLTIPVSFIGTLNRFDEVTATNNLQSRFDYLVILSGPEPERTNFLNSMRDKLAKNNKKMAIVGVRIDNATCFPSPTTAELKELIQKSNTVVTRAGYTSIMELAGLNKQAELYPTKGQYEQEYLAKHVKIEHFTFKSL